jgi:hypothetical protein
MPKVIDGKNISLWGNSYGNVFAKVFTNRKKNEFILYKVDFDGFLNGKFRAEISVPKGCRKEYLTILPK